MMLKRARRLSFEQATHHRRPPRFLPTVDLSQV